MISTGAPFALTARNLTATVTHVDEGGWTLCGIRVGDTWAGQYDAGIPSGLPTCQRCSHRVAVLPPAVIDAPATDAPRKLRRRYRGDTDTFDVLSGNDVLGTVDPTRDRTGDYLARAAAGEIVAPRFNGPTEAEQYIRTGVRPVMCRREFGGYGACIRQDAHGDMCQDAHGHRFNGRRVATFAEWNLAVAMAADAEADMAARAARARSMAAHPAGKRRAVKITDTFTGYPNNVHPYNRDGGPWALDRTGATIPVV